MPYLFLALSHVAATMSSSFSHCSGEPAVAFFGRFRRDNPEEVTPRFENLVERVLAQTATPSIVITAREVDSLPLTVSKFFGEPYLPSGAPHPRGVDGEPLGFLAQIRFDELPANWMFPETGMLQFWIGTNDVLGQNYVDLLTNNYAMIYYPHVDDSVTETHFIPPPPFEQGDHFSPYYGDGCYELSFEVETQTMGMHDYRFDTLFISAYEQEFGAKDVGSILGLPSARSDYLKQTYETGGHRMGGYPAFTQYDRRESEPGFDFLLLQMDSINGINWGSAGIGHFFISPEDLKNADFSRVGYTWDCG